MQSVNKGVLLLFPNKAQLVFLIKSRHSMMQDPRQHIYSQAGKLLWMGEYYFLF